MTPRDEFKAWLKKNKLIIRRYTPDELTMLAVACGFDRQIVIGVLSHFETAIRGASIDRTAAFHVGNEVHELETRGGKYHLHAQWSALYDYLQHGTTFKEDYAWDVMETIAKGANMKLFIIASLLFAVVPLHAYDRSLNPDRYTSVGLDVSKGKLAGMLTDTGSGPNSDGGFVKGLLDVRVPVSNAVTFHAFGSSTGVNNNRQFSNGSEVGVGMRVYLQ